MQEPAAEMSGAAAVDTAHTGVKRQPAGNSFPAQL